ncbi:glycosyltransferase family 39 protein [bacterium]|nr:glycosyltransferase family 39 protein [bacterium]
MTASFSKKQFLGFLIFLSIAVLMRWNTFTAPLERDEGEYAYGAWIMTKGMLPYVDTFLQKPPMIIHIYRFGMMLSDHPILPFRLLAFLSSIITSLLVAKIAAKFTGKEYFWVGAYFNFGLLSLPSFFAFVANTEIFMILPLTLALERYYFARKSDSLQSAIFGALLAIALFTKPICMPATVLLVLCWAYQVQFNLAVTRLFFVVLGGAAAMLMILAPFLSVDAIYAMYDSVVRFNRLYIQFFEPWAALDVNMRESSVLVFFLILGFYGQLKSKNHILPLCLLTLSILVMRWSVFPHYAIMLVPYIALIASIGLAYLLANIYTSHSTRDRIAVLAVIFTFSISPSLQYILLKPELYSWFIYNESNNNFTGAKKIGERLNELTTQNDRILVAGLEPEILWYAKRLSSSRYIIQAPLALKTSETKRYVEEFKSELSSNPPKYIAIALAENSYFYRSITDAFDEYSSIIMNEISSHYQLVGGVNGLNYDAEFLSELNFNVSRKRDPAIYLFGLKR